VSQKTIKWEYRTVWVDKLWTVLSDIGCAGHAAPQSEGFVEYLNRIGQDGWELVTILPGDKGHRAFLKRPV